MSKRSERYLQRLVDFDALESYLKEHLGSADTFEIEHHKEGHSNETLFVTWDDRELVIRRPPPGETADTAHDVLREYNVLKALQDTDVRVPTTVLSCNDHNIIGSDFYVMEREEGIVIREKEPDQFTVPEHRQAVGKEMIDTLTEIHEVDYEAIGLQEFGYPNGFTQRQIDRWEEQYEWAFQVTAEEREVPEVHEVTKWLQNNVPEVYPHTLIHGDYKLDNVMFDFETYPQITTVFDWEMSTLGDPFTDLGWMLSYWPTENDQTDKVGTSSDLDFLLRDGYPSRTELVKRYESITGYEFENDRFYRVLAVYKLGALGEMFFRRYLQGNSNDETYPQMKERVPALAHRALRICEGEEQL
jgi:aminoglycoside phosphotransferase (APT) family kinase protein